MFVLYAISHGACIIETEFEMILVLFNQNVYTLELCKVKIDVLCYPEMSRPCIFI